MLTNQQFDRNRHRASRLAGIELVARHRELLERRGKRLDFVENVGWENFLHAVESNEPSAIQKFLCLLTTKHTGFFRHPRHFEIAAQHALRVARKQGQMRLWSAAAATGEEPWSLTMALIEAFGGDDSRFSILATDVDTEALAAAQRGEYGELAMRPVSPDRRARFFKYDSGTKTFSITPSLRRFVEFRPLNLADVAWSVEGPCEVIFCRNVLMYFEADYRYAVLERMASLLAPGGLLLLDPTEHLGQAAHWFSAGDYGVYSRRREVWFRDGTGAGIECGRP